MSDRRTALITGASAGIGAAFARVFAERGFDLILTARREERMIELGRELRESTGADVRAIAADLSDPSAPAELHAEISSQGCQVDALVNNAGFGVPGTFRSREWSDHAALMQVLMVSLVQLTYLFESGMTERGYGRIINVASLAGLVPASARHTLYAPAKSFVIRFSEALAQEHTADGVHVTALCPGYTRTEFHDAIGNRKQVSKLPPMLWRDAYSVARDGFDAVMVGETVHVVGGINRALAALVRALPATVARRVMASQWKRVRSD